MKRLLRTEYLKLRAARKLAPFAAAAVVLGAAMAAVQLNQADFGARTVPLSGPGYEVTQARSDSAPKRRSDTEKAQRALTVWTGAVLLTALLGMVIAGSEHKHGTIGVTALATPRRARIVVSKLALAAILAVPIMALALTANLVVALPWLASEHVSPHFSAGDWVELAIGGACAAAAAAALGVGLATILRLASAAMFVLLAVVSIVEPEIAHRSAEIARYGPGSALLALTGGHTAPDILSKHLLPLWAGALVALGWATLSALVAIQVLQRRDLR